MNRSDALKRTELFGSLPDPDLRAVSEVCSERKLEKGGTLFTAGEAAQGLFVIVRGAVRAYRVNEDGREQVIHVERAGGTIAELPVFDGKPLPSTVVAEEDSDLLYISKPDMDRLMVKHPTIALSALKLLASRLRKTAALVESLSLREVDQRLASYLLQEFNGRGSREKGVLGVQLPPNAVVAARVGSVREVVSRAFTKLEEAGFIRLDSRHFASLLDERGLRERAGE